MRQVTALFLCFSFFIATAPSLLAKQNFLGSPANFERPSSGSQSSTDESPPPQGKVIGLAKGVKQVAYEGPKEFVKETAEEAPKKPPIVNVIEGVNKGTEKLLDHTIKGAYKVATLGTGELESYEVQEPEKGSGEPTKFKISLPGT